MFEPYFSRASSPTCCKLSEPCTTTWPLVKQTSKQSGGQHVYVAVLSLECGKQLFQVVQTQVARDVILVRQLFAHLRNRFPDGSRFSAAHDSENHDVKEGGFESLKWAHPWQGRAVCRRWYPTPRSSRNQQRCWAEKLARGKTLGFGFVRLLWEG